MDYYIMIFIKGKIIETKKNENENQTSLYMRLPKRKEHICSVEWIQQIWKVSCSEERDIYCLIIANPWYQQHKFETNTIDKYN